MSRLPATLSAALLALVLTAAGPCLAATSWTAGTHYDLLSPTQRTTVPPGMIEVLEVFSYGCPACFSFEPIMQQLKAKLPANARLTHLPASWNAAENWPAFQRSWFAAKSLNIADGAHQAMYDAIWKTGELAVIDGSTRRPKTVLPSIADIAKFYERTAGIKTADFLSAAMSPAVEAKMRSADAQIKAMQIPGTPTIVVHGKYRVNTEALGSVDELAELVNFLVAKETPRKAG